MLWQDRNGSWHSTVSPVDLKIMEGMIQETANRVWEEKDLSGDNLFDELFGG